MFRNFNLLDSPLKRGDFVVSAQSNDKGVCKFSVTHPQPLFLEGSLKVAAFGSLINPLEDGAIKICHQCTDA